MAIDSVIAQIDSEIAKLTQVRSLLAGAGKTSFTVHDGKAKKTPPLQTPGFVFSSERATSS